jgi:hypothetical protein
MQSFGELLWYVRALPDWLSYLIVVVVMTWTACMAGVALGKAGRSPVWALLVFLPYLFTIGLWILALGRWPREPGQGSSSSGA